MAPQNQNQSPSSFDPSRDIDRYLQDDAEALRQRGLQRQSIRLYELLCRLCMPGETQLVYRQQADLVAELKRLFPEDDGITEGSVSRKLNRLTSLGFASKSGGGQSKCLLIIELRWPDEVGPKPPRLRHPTVTPSGERQGQLFKRRGPFRVVRCDDDMPKAQTLALSKAQSLSVPPPESANACAFDPASAEEHTSSPRTRVCTRGVDDVDVVVSTVEEMEIHEARAALRRTLALWKRVGIPSSKRQVFKKNRSYWLKTHTLFLRGIISEAQFERGVSAPVETNDSSEIETSAWQVAWGAWEKAIPGYREKLTSLRFPRGWHELMLGEAVASAESRPSQPVERATTAPTQRRKATPEEVLEFERMARKATGLDKPRHDAAANGEQPQQE